MPDYLKTARKITATRFGEIIHKYIHCSKSELEDALRAPQTLALDLCVIKVLVESIKNGDEKRLNFLLERIIGKVKEVREVHHSGSDSPIDLKKLTPTQLEQLKVMVEQSAIELD